MRDVKDPAPAEAHPETGGWLHLDVSRGATGELLIAALLDLGLEEGALQEGFLAAGLPVGARVSEGRRGELAGRRVVLVDEAGRALLAAGDERSPTALSPRAPARRRRHEPHKDARPERTLKAMGTALDGGPQEGEPQDGEGEHGGQVVPFGGEESGPSQEPPRGPRDPVRTWLAGARAPAEALLAQLWGADLPPIAKALALKALRRAFDALAEVQRRPRAELTLAGPLGVQLLAEAVGAGVLLEALSPGRVTATAVALDAVSDPWLDAALVGVLAEERELGFAPTTPLGAALVWALAVRFGPRGELVVGQAGTGLGGAEQRGQTHLLRALYGPLPAGATRRGAAAHLQGSAFWLDARLGPDADRPRLLAALHERGASSPVETAGSAAEGPIVRFGCAVGPDDLDAAVRVLWREGGADEVLVTHVERRRPARREVTVAVGRANRREWVRLVELEDEGEGLRVEVSREDLLAASRRLGVPLSTLREEALAARDRPPETREEP